MSSNKEFAKRFTDHDLYRELGIEKRGTAVGYRHPRSLNFDHTKRE